VRRWRDWSLQRSYLLLFAALALSLLSCKAEVPGSKDSVKGAQPKRDAARPAPTAARPSVNPNGTLVAVVTHEKYTAEGRLERYVRLKKGDQLRLAPRNDVSGPEFLYRYQSEREIKPTRAGRYFKVNGKIVGALISGDGHTVDIKALHSAPKQIRTLHWRNDRRLDSKTVDAILQLASNDLTLIYGGTWLPKNGLQQLKRIAHKVSVLHLDYPSYCEPLRSNELDQQMLKVMRVFARAKEIQLKPYAYFTYALRRMSNIPNLRGLDTEHAYIDDMHLKLIGHITTLRRLEIVSPGGFPPGITADNLLWRQAPRNRRVAEVLAKCDLVERSGQGANLMFEACAKRCLITLTATTTR